jgi:DNA topoisomerase I
MVSDASHLLFGSDQEPGIRRRGMKRFSYVYETSGRPASRADLDRIHGLAVPPAWTKVWISAERRSHLQATGRDARGRKQYRYHPAFTASQADDKFADLVSFGHALASLRGRVSRDLARHVVDHDRVVATVVRLLDITSLRIGNAEYSRTNHSFGLTTLRNRHVDVRGATIRFAFRGKSAHEFDVRVDNARLAKIVRRCQHLPGQQLFEYRAADGEIRRIGSTDVNAYLVEHAGPGVTAKTFRTWNATVRAADWLAGASEHDEPPTNRVLNEIIDEVAAHLGNTRAVCRNSYIHPAVVTAYIESTLLTRWRRRVGSRPASLTVAERKTLRLLRGAERKARAA